MELSKVHILLTATPEIGGAPKIETYAFSDKKVAICFAAQHIIDWLQKNKGWIAEEYPSLVNFLALTKSLDVGEMIFLLYRIEIQTTLGPSPTREQLARFVTCEVWEDRVIDSEAIPIPPQKPKTRTELLEIE